MKAKSTEDHLKQFLNHSIPIKDIRGSVFGLTLILVDFIMLAFIFADPFVKGYRDGLLPPIVLLNLFALWIGFAPVKRRQVVVNLYIGILGLFASVGYLVLLQKIVYDMMDLSSLLYLILSVLVYVGLFVFIGIGLPKFVAAGNFFKNFLGGARGLYAGLASLGVLLGHIAIGYNHGSYKLAGLAFVFAMMTVLMQVFGAILLYRYLLIRKHPDWFIYERASGKKNRKGA